MVCTYQCKKPFKLTRNQSLAAVTALKSVGRKVGLTEKLAVEYIRECTDCSIREYWSANVATNCRTIIVDLGLTLFQSLFSQFHCIKMEVGSTVPLSRNPWNCPKCVFYPSGYLVSYLPSGLRELLKIGMHEANRHIMFGSKFGKIWLSHSEVIKTKIKNFEPCNSTSNC